MISVRIRSWGLALLTIASLTSSVVAEGKNWVLLIAGSAGYGNYRHQSDVCHAYQIVHKNGIPDEQIVVMMYDDIANNRNNPYPGNIINRPGGPNVYPGVTKDYTGDDVNADTYLAVLQGDKAKVRELLGRKGKVIESGPDDYVFVNFADYGGPGILGMPSLPYLKARDLNRAFEHMYTTKHFAKLVFYVEACEAGSNFENLLPKNINVYVTTASNAHEYSYGCFCENDRNTCLGDLYSVNWTQNSDVADLHTETLKRQYEIVKSETNESHVMQYGDLSFTQFHWKMRETEITDCNIALYLIKEMGMISVRIRSWGLALLTIASLTSSVVAEGKNWVLLIAGSAGYGNYRHQSDVCHAYQIVHKNGIPDEQIVVMMYDNIANNRNNPYPGNIINRPGGPNVYPGVTKDYTGDDVNADTYLAVLQGDKAKVRELLGRKGKVIESGPDDCFRQFR